MGALFTGALAGAFFFALEEAVVFVKAVRGAVRAPRLTGDGGRMAARAMVVGKGPLCICGACCVVVYVVGVWS
jgi:hypothetical protein